MKLHELTLLGTREYHTGKFRFYLAKLKAIKQVDFGVILVYQK